MHCIIISHPDPPFHRPRQLNRPLEGSDIVPPPVRSAKRRLHFYRPSAIYLPKFLLVRLLMALVLRASGLKQSARARDVSIFWSCAQCASGTGKRVSAAGRRGRLMHDWCSYSWGLASEFEWGGELRFGVLIGREIVRRNKLMLLKGGDKPFTVSLCGGLSVGLVVLSKESVVAERDVARNRRTAAEPVHLTAQEVAARLLQ